MISDGDYHDDDDVWEAEIARILHEMKVGCSVSMAAPKFW